MKTSKQEAIATAKELAMEKEAREKSEYEKSLKERIEVIWPYMHMRT